MVDRGEKIWAAVVFEEVPSDGQSGTWKYTIRLNASVLPPTFLRKGGIGVGDYMTSGFASLQEAINRAILRTETKEDAMTHGLTRGMPITYYLPYPEAARHGSQVDAFVGQTLPLVCTFAFVIPLFMMTSSIVQEKALATSAAPCVSPHVLWVLGVSENLNFAFAGRWVKGAASPLQRAP